jgi:hypothetical protein
MLPTAGAHPLDSFHTAVASWFARSFAAPTPSLAQAPEPAQLSDRARTVAWLAGGEVHFLQTPEPRVQWEAHTALLRQAVPPMAADS